MASYTTPLHFQLPQCSKAYRGRCSVCFRSDVSLPRKHTRLSGRRQYRPSTISATEQEQSPEDVQEAMLERREKNARRRRDSSSYRQTQQKQQKQRQLSKDGKPRWPEGQLFPDGWEDMGPFAKAWQIYAGERGALFWANKLAYIAVFVIVGGWILFRVVFPALGLYQLTNDISTPTKY